MTHPSILFHYFVSTYEISMLWILQKPEDSSLGSGCKYIIIKEQLYGDSIFLRQRTARKTEYPQKA